MTCPVRLPHSFFCATRLADAAICDCGYADLQLEALLADILERQQAALTAQADLMRRIEDLITILNLTQGGAQS